MDDAEIRKLIAVLTTQLSDRTQKLFKDFAVDYLDFLQSSDANCKDDRGLSAKEHKRLILE